MRHYCVVFIAALPGSVVSELSEIVAVSVESQKIPYGGTGHQVDVCTVFWM